MSIFEQYTPASKSNKANTEKAPRKLWVNIGIPVKLGEETVFVNVPLGISADNLSESIEREIANRNKSNSDQYTAIQEGKIALGNAVKALFDGLAEGQSVTALESNDPLVQKLQIQFYKASEKEAPSNAEEMRKGILNAMLNS